MTIDSIGSAAFNAADFAALRHSLFQKSDANADGSLSQDELTAAIKNAPRPPGASDAKVPSANKLFQQLDTNGDNKISESELEAGGANKDAKMKSGGGAPPAGGPPPGGGGGGGKTSGTDDSSSSTKYYDKMDTDKDGTVSYDEKVAYLLKHPEAALDEKRQAALSKPPPPDGTGLMFNAEA